MALESIPAAVVEVAAYIVGKVLGRSFKINPDRAHRIGEWVIFGVIAVAGIIVTVVYS